MRRDGWDDDGEPCFDCDRGEVWARLAWLAMIVLPFKMITHWREVRQWWRESGE